MTAESMYPYQDSTLGLDQRLEDLLSRMDLEDKVGTMFHPMGTVGSLDEPGLFGSPPVREVFDRRINHMNVLMVPSARELAEWYNMIQRTALGSGLGIPVSISSDPRHAFSDNPVTSFFAGPFSQWPEPLGFAAIGSEELVLRFGDVVRAEYVAVGIRVALHPQIDLATEPRWVRQSATFGEDADLAARLGVAYVRGLQGPDIGPASVSAMAKHFPGGGPQKDGEDPHFAYGREQVYPGGQFELHMEPFRLVIQAGVSQIMPYYGVPVGTDLEEVGFGFNKQVISGLLRDRLGFDGVVCTDWGILNDRCWGVEHLSVEERMLKALDAGVDQFGGETCTDVMISAVKSGSVGEERINTSVRRLLTEKFRLGLFDDPLVDSDHAPRIVGAAAVREEGLTAQASACTLLKNAEDGPAVLPLLSGLKIYAESVAPESFRERAQVVGTPQEADVAVLRLKAPWEQRGELGDIESFFHSGSLAFSAEEIERIEKIATKVPTIVDVHLDRPAILGPIADAVSALLVNFGADDEAFTRILFGEVRPRGRLPFDIPSSMKAVEESRPDVPFDTAAPTYRFGYGLAYP